VPADDSRREASRLARWLLGWDEAAWLTRSAEAPPSDFPARFAAAVARRRRREPLAYILGEREFYGRAFLVTPAVLIPRPETELVVDEALTIIRSGTGRPPSPPASARQAPPSPPASARQAPPSPPASARQARHLIVVDIGTGSGCLAITIALECPDVRVIAVDTSAAALQVARENARRHGVADRIEFRQGDLLQPLTDPVDLVVSNPPYVPERDRPSIAPEVAGYEPAGALFAGADGLDVVRALIPAAARALAPGGSLVMEFGWGQSSEIAQLVERTPRLALRHIRQDLQGIPRVVVAEQTGAIPT
jgi:release factor glutamine methyltransferase